MKQYCRHYSTIALKTGACKRIFEIVHRRLCMKLCLYNVIIKVIYHETVLFGQFVAIMRSILNIQMRPHYTTIEFQFTAEGMTLIVSCARQTQRIVIAGSSPNYIPIEIWSRRSLETAEERRLGTQR